MKILILFAFILLVLAQWFVPGQMMIEKSKILSGGRALKFRTEPVDPYDQFRGKYIYLKFKESQVTRVNDTSNKSIDLNKDVYVSFKNDNEGFAKVDSFSNLPFPGKIPYVRANVYRESLDDSAKGTLEMLNITFPFEKFYMEESKAGPAEVIYRQRNRDSTSKVYALVYLLDGRAAIKDVYVNDTSISTLVKLQQK
ncbi:MAG: hypothetical protein C5B52_12090 [Bacteroidetes bacterium]|nr:MAG: hypothetical protein C5B52_12090 [Bacteroidota bacterium]